jgi:hypothetical protein
MPEVVFQHPLLDGHLGTGLKVLHFAPTARACVQAKMGAPWPDSLRRLMVYGRDHTGFPIVFLSVHIDRHQLERQSAFYKNDFAIRLAGNALGLNVQGIYVQPTGW